MKRTIGKFAFSFMLMMLLLMPFCAEAVKPILISGAMECETDFLIKALSNSKDMEVLDEMEEKRIDMRIDSEDNRKLMEEAKRSTQLCFRINHTMPMTPECDALINELFQGNIDENSRIAPPLQVIRGNTVTIGKNVSIMYNWVCMSTGGLVVEDNVMIAANCSS